MNVSGQAATLRRWLDERPFVVLDGGLATSLEALGHDLGDELWSARLLRDDPDSIGRVHRDFLQSGADCIVTASYQASYPGLEAAGLEVDEATRLLQRSIAIAATACESHDGSERPVVAASVGPYGAYLADGSEYVGDYGIDDAALRAFHAPRWQVLAADCDLLACETLPSLDEARVLLDLLHQTPGAAAWFAFSCRDETTISDGTPLAECAELCAESEQVLAVGVNCTPPHLVEPLIGEIRRAAPDLPVIVYPNSGESYDEDAKSWRGSAGIDAWPKAVHSWWCAGARLIGGCCRTGPDEIRATREALIEVAGDVGWDRFGDGGNDPTV